MSAESHTVNRRNGITQGVFVMTGFGLFWAILAATGVSPAAAAIGLAVPAVATAIAVLVVALRWAAESVARGTTRRVAEHSRQVFTLVNVGQAVLILIAVFGLVRAGHPGLIPAAVCLVVGLHFLPLARVFDVRTYLATGALLIAVAVVGAVVYAAASDDALVRVVVGLPAAIALWTSSLLIARRG
ncbi:hypothetical protein GCM10010168_25960 [Actinoplanes ianthinogenes]|uniref:Uncharacterized protein n=1 Tax=Actinoplanes ianthinogenes TaxID=122358 RepID=A0ABM7M9A2_9ACTN|nr:hypothetical protein [Actinoplanes ianthinogenes]BCJ48236.1 hypothetical protein Aiant_88930 [Actinoplanes ianthinogenes]GGR07333.1 hypothetical protein GCM10010168_25960 [Actinoplanes ianthinogenes]